MGTMKDKTIYALGFFDGVHLGHAALLSACREMAQAEQCRAGVVTFLGHPDTLVLGITPTLINTPEDRKKLLTEQFSMDTVTELLFDRTLMNMPWEEFFHRLIHEWNAGGLVCGDDFRFGQGGKGTAQALYEACMQTGIPCRIIPEQTMDGVRVSSSHIRALLEQGLVTQANRFLGHPHILSGCVQEGKHLGRTIGIPTANLRYPQNLIGLPFGVYACNVHADGKIYRAVTNIGTRPTVDGKDVTVESWLQHYDGDLYGKHITLEFLEYLRPEKKFPSLEALKAQIQIDAAQANAL